MANRPWHPRTARASLAEPPTPAGERRARRDSHPRTRTGVGGASRARRDSQGTREPSPESQPSAESRAHRETLIATTRRDGARAPRSRATSPISLREASRALRSGTARRSNAMRAQELARTASHVVCASRCALCRPSSHGWSGGAQAATPPSPHSWRVWHAATPPSSPRPRRASSRRRVSAATTACCAMRRCVLRQLFCWR